jgi:hypothetical protein
VRMRAGFPSTNIYGGTGFEQVRKAIANAKTWL